MSLSVKGLAWTGAVLWGGCFLLVGLLNQVRSSYGILWLTLGASIYPGYRGPAGWGSVLLVVLWAVVDGAIAGALFGWVYNRFAGAGRTVPSA